MPARKASLFGLLGTLTFAFVLWFTVGSWSTGSIDRMDDPMCEALLNDPESVDAIEWLKTPSRRPHRVGTMTVDEALGLAYKLQELGATRITTDRLDQRVRSREGNPNRPSTEQESRGLVFHLPENPAQRLALFHLYAKLVSNAGKTPRADVGQKYLFVPWTRDESGSLD